MGNKEVEMSKRDKLDGKSHGFLPSIHSECSCLHKLAESDFQPMGLRGVCDVSVTASQELAAFVVSRTRERQS